MTMTMAEHFRNMQTRIQALHRKPKAGGGFELPPEAAYLAQIAQAIAELDERLAKIEKAFNK